jgi:hypothetical protein
MEEREKVLAIREKRVNNQLKSKLKQRAKPKALKARAPPKLKAPPRRRNCTPKPEEQDESEAGDELEEGDKLEEQIDLQT